MAKDEQKDELVEFTLRAPSIPVHGEGLYPTLWTGLKVDKRLKYGTKQTDNNKPSDFEPCVRFGFTAIHDQQPKWDDAIKLWVSGEREKALELISFMTYVDDYNEIKPVRFNATIGLNFVEGSDRSNTTKYIQGIVGRKVSSKEVIRLGMVKLFTASLHPVNITVVIKDTDDGQRNQIVSARRPDKLFGKSISPIDLSAYMLEEPKDIEAGPFDDD